MSADIFIFPTVRVERDGGTHVSQPDFKARVRIGPTMEMAITGDISMKLVEIRVGGQILNLTPEQADEISVSLHRAWFHVTDGGQIPGY